MHAPGELADVSELTGTLRPNAATSPRRYATTPFLRFADS